MEREVAICANVLMDIIFNALFDKCLYNFSISQSWLIKAQSLHFHEKQP